MENSKERKLVAGIFEDDKSYYEIIHRILEEAGFTVAFIATTLQAALDEIAQFEVYGGVNLVTVDGNLGDFNYGQDAKKIIQRLRALSPQTIIIGLSGNSLPVESQDHSRPGVNVDLGKSNTIQLKSTLQTLFAAN